MQAAERKLNPFINSPAGGRALSAVQLPFFLVRPPSGYGVLTTTGRKTGKVRRRCVRAIRQGDVVYVVAIKGKTQWARNALANPAVRLRLPGGTFSARAREVNGATESQRAKEAYCEAMHRFDCLLMAPGPLSVRFLRCSGLAIGLYVAAARFAALPPLPEGCLEPTGDEDVERGGNFAAAVLEVVSHPRRDADERASRRVDPLVRD
jgi:deazaflavin-dependent oxidoreductase (nitroreductase family)